ncbi:MAG: ABC transporter ATP-binding protein [Bacilli bacterium]|nr:ABC transporter ATP-binding protein [Acholeplasmataceae bacterium]MDY2902464.1 ABC transporter ATP-binding protein [Bacilli bacterium]
MENIIEIKHLNKTFKEVHAVNDLSFCVKKGELFAFLGVNGAGKSTTISIICGMLEKDTGEVLINGKNIETDMKEISNKIGVVFQNSVLDNVLSVKDNLISRASLYGLYGKEANNKIFELSKLLNFEDLLNRTVGKLSGGQRRRIDVARALLHDPEILILDEPTTGLDPQTRKTLWNVIQTYRKEKKMTVFLTTHYMEETVDADYVIILDSGKIAAEGTPLELKNKYTGDFITIYNKSINQIDKLNLKYELIKDGIRIEVKNTEEAKKLIIQYPDFFTDFEITKGKMDDVFLSVTGKKLNGDN